MKAVVDIGKMSPKEFALWFNANRKQAIFQKIDEQFSDREESWAIKHLIELRIFPVLDGIKRGGRKESPERAKARLCAVLNLPFKRPEQKRSGLIAADNLSDGEWQTLAESRMKHDKFLDSNPAKSARAYANELEKTTTGERHSVLCNDLEWEVLTRWRKEVSVALKKRELKVFVDKLRNKTSLSNLITTIHRLRLSRNITK